MNDEFRRLLHSSLITHHPSFIILAKEEALMPLRHLQTRFILAGCLLVATTVGIGLWSALTFARLSAAAADDVRESQETIDLSAELAGSLEREDDDLLLVVEQGAGAPVGQLAPQRQRSDDCCERLLAVVQRVGEDEEKALVRRLRGEIDAYRAAGAELGEGSRSGVLTRYQRRVNPLLRRAVGTCGKIREVNFETMRRAGVRARDEARQATWVVAGAGAAAVVLATVVSVWLARSVLRPVRVLTDSVEALRQGEFDRRVPVTSGDELGLLADGFNRLAQTLAEYRRSSLGELLAAKTTLEATLNALPDAVLVVAPDGTLAALNPPARAVLEALRAAGAARLTELPLRPEHRAAVQAALSGRPGVPVRTDFSPALAADLAGRSQRFLLSAFPIPEFTPGRCGVVIVLDDVTEFARLDELRAELIGVASHELKTPLTTVRVNLLLLSEEAEQLTSRQREMLDAALGGCEELRGAIDELLDMTRIEAGQLRLDLSPVDLSEVLEQALGPLRPRFEDAEVRLHVAREGRPRLARGDAARLRIVLTNLLTNALKYSPAGGTVTVLVSSEQNAGTNGSPSLQIAVTDDGPGVPAEFRERVFEKFFRVEHHREASATGVRGTGIGLYLCREIVKAHGGSIHCEPGDHGIGTRIAFELPLPAA
jgi:NtrC-family two-component system sensor histidine kinase KinB